MPQRKELTMAEYVDAIDKIQETEVRYQTLRFLQNNMVNRFREASLMLAFCDVKRIKSLREMIKAEVQTRDSKFGNKYWDQVARQVGLVI